MYHLMCKMGKEYTDFYHTFDLDKVITVYNYWVKNRYISGIYILVELPDC